MRANLQEFDVVINEPSDWKALAPAADAIVGPTVFRAADVFVSGESGDVNTVRRIWKALLENTTSLIAFFDILVFSEQLPLIDYRATLLRQRAIRSRGSTIS